MPDETVLPAGFSTRPIGAGGGAGLPAGFSVRPLPPPADPLTSAAQKGGEGLAEGAKALFWPHSPAQAALTIAAPMMPLAGKAAEGLEDVAPLASKGLQTLEAGGWRGPLARMGLQTGIGAVAGGQEGAKEGAEQGMLGEALIPPAGAVANRLTGAAGAMEAGTNVLRTDAADAAAQKALENELGMTAEQAQKLAVPKLEQASGAMGQPEYSLPGAQPLAQGKRAVGDVRRGAIRTIGQKFDPIYNPIADNPAPDAGLAKIGSAVQDAQQFAASKGATLSPRVQKFLGDLQGIASTKEMPDIQAAGGGSFKLTNDQIAQVNQETGGQFGVQTIGKLRGKLGEAMTLANAAGTSSWDRAALFKATRPIAETLDNAIPEEQKPLLESIKNEYAQVNRIFPFKNQQKINSAATLPQLGEMLLGKDMAKGTALVIPRMNEAQKDLMRQVVASHVLSESVSPTEALSRLQQNKDTIGELFDGTRLANINKWRDLTIAGRKFRQGPPDLPSQKQFTQGVQDEIKKSGFTPEAFDAATKAIAQGAQGTPRLVRYATSPWAIAGALGGFGLFGHEPAAMGAAAVWLASHAGFKAMTENPGMLDNYAKFIMSGWTKAGGEAFGRAMVSGINNALQGTQQPQLQQHKTLEGPATDALNKSRAETISPVPSGAKRAEKVSREMSKGKAPEVHRDLTTGRLSMDEVGKLVKHGSAQGMDMANVTPAQMLDAAEVGTDEEKRAYLPLIRQKLAQAMGKKDFNRTEAANLARRYQKLASANQMSAEG